MTRKFCTLILAFSLLPAALAFADGPCGNGKYVYECTPSGGCGAPSGCHMVCEGPEGAVNDSESRTSKITVSVPDSEAPSLPRHFTIVNNACL